MIQKAEIPMLRGTIVNVEQDGLGIRWATVAVRCPECKHQHVHSITLLKGDTPFKIHRVAQCPAGTPFFNTGYYIIVDPADVPKPGKRKAMSRPTKK